MRGKARDFRDWWEKCWHYGKVGGPIRLLPMFLLTLLAFGGGFAVSLIANVALFDVIGLAELGSQNYQMTIFRRYPLMAFSAFGAVVALGVTLCNLAGVLGAFFWGAGLWFAILIGVGLYFNLPLIVQGIKERFNK